MYFLTANLDGAAPKSGNAITVQAPGVTIEFGGFTMTGPGDAAAITSF